jgi:hypothetical protein
MLKTCLYDEKTRKVARISRKLTNFAARYLEKGITYQTVSPVSFSIEDFFCETLG